MSRFSKVRKFTCRVLDFSIYLLIFISRQNKLVCAQRASKKITRFVPLRDHLLDIHCRGEDLAPFPPRRFYCTTFASIVVRMQCISVDFTSRGFVRFATYAKEEWRISCLGLPLICCRMQGERTDFCKVTIEVLNLFLGEK